MTAEDDPVTLSIAAAAGSGALAAGSSLIGGSQAKQAALEQGRQDTQEAAVARASAGADVSNQTEDAAHTISKVEAGAGAAGVTASSANPILSEDYTQAKIRAAYTRFSGNLASTEDIYAARIAKYQGQQAMWKGIFGAGQAVLGTASNLGSIAISKGWGSGSGWGGATGPGSNGPLETAAY